MIERDGFYQFIHLVLIKQEINLSLIIVGL